MDTFENPAEALQAAIEKLEVFTQPEAGGLALQEDGSLIAVQGNALERVMGVARHFIAPLFSDQARQEREKKLSQIKQEILRARDILQSHSSLIDKLKDGEPSQQKLAQSALDAIQRYNAVVERDYSSWTTKYDFYNFERNQILLDEEIKGQPIELPHAVSIRYESHTNHHPAQKSLKELSKAFLGKSDATSRVQICPTHKKSEQFMLDTFRMKAVRMIQSHLSNHHSMAEILNLVKQTPIEMEDEGATTGLIIMRQVLEETPGTKIILTGSFKRFSTDSKFMHMPMFDNFHLESHIAHAGFPYPSQHTGWALSESLVEAFPLRGEQVPLFQQVDQKRKRLAKALLFDQAFIQKSRLLSKLKREAFDQNRQAFLTLHQALQESILKACGKDSQEAIKILSTFYETVAAAPSAFDKLNHVQQKLNDLLIKEPAKLLEEEWLEAKGSLLRKGNHQEKLQQAGQLLQKHREELLAALDPSRPLDAYIHLMGNILGESSQSAILQYFSEKIGFAPPMLNEFEQKIQACAFHQLIAFLDEFNENQFHTLETAKEKMIQLFHAEIHLFNVETIDDLNQLSAQIVQELEVYFPSRFYQRYPRKSYLPSTIE